MRTLHPLDLSRLSFVGEALSTLRSEVGDTAAVLGFVGSPWTLATYIVEGASSSLYKTIKCMAHSNPALLDALLSQLADAMAAYIVFQIEAGAQCVQIFDSWGGQLPPREWDRCVGGWCEGRGGRGEGGGGRVVAMQLQQPPDMLELSPSLHNTPPAH